MSHEERERLERELLRALKAAEREYRAAAKEHEDVRQQFASLLDNPDGALALRKAARNERLVGERYAQALKRFSNFVMHGTLPEDATGPKL
jgi:hypothetical protein